MGYTIPTSYPSPPLSTTGIDTSHLHDIELNDDISKPSLPSLSARLRHLLVKIVSSILHVFSFPGIRRRARSLSLRDNDEKEAVQANEQVIYMICEECGDKKKKGAEVEKRIGDPVRYFYEDEMGDNKSLGSSPGGRGGSLASSLGRYPLTKERNAYRSVFG